MVARQPSTPAAPNQSTQMQFGGAGMFVQISYSWRYELAATRNAVEVYVGYLRRKLDAAGAGGIVRTVRGHGYLASSSELDAIAIPA